MIEMTSAATTPPPERSLSGEVARKKMIAERQERSVFWKVVHLLGSLKLALCLLAAIAIACAVATFYESGFSAKIAQHYIYKAPWFLFWLGLLCVNLFSVTLTRWPWQKKHTGFIITHYGIIILLIGAVIGSQFGFEGNVNLHKDRPPLNRVVTSRSIIQIEDPNSPALLVKPFDALVTRPTARRPRVLPVPGTDWQIVAVEAAEDLVTEDILVEPVAGTPVGPAAVLRWESQTAEQNERMVLQTSDPARARQSLFGMADIRLQNELPRTRQETAVETQMVLARFAPVLQGPASGITILLDPDGETVRVIPPQGSAATYRRADLMGETIEAGGARIFFPEYWPDFVMRDGQPATQSEEPNNPALLARVTFSMAVAEGEPTAGTTGTELTNLEFRASVVPGTTPGEETLVYQLWRQGQLTREGRAALGETVATGWNDWNFTVEALSPSASILRETRPAREGVAEERTGVPGFLAWLEASDGQRGEPTWVESGNVTTLRIDHRFVRLAYGLQLQEVPFSIRLVDFEVPRFEGTQTPANFIATVEFRDPVTGETKVDDARMNKPANWPGGWGPLLTGINYKFSQAEWNPRNLSETTLQVLYDPGWMLKWIGSLAICVGITLMFYWKPRQKNP
jgi:hypothetical protein